MRMNGWIVLGLMLVASVAQGREARLKDMNFEISGGERIVVNGLKGSVTFVPSSQPGQMLIRARKTLNDKAPANAQANFDNWNLDVQREDQVLRVTVLGPRSKADWSEQIQQGGPEFHIEIAASGLPAEVAWHQGAVSAREWKGNLTIATVDGVVRLQKGIGDVRVQVQKGEISIAEHKGRVEVDSNGARVGVKGVDGDLTVHNFAGESALQDVKGNVRLRSFTGGTMLSQAAGDVDFENGRSTLNVTGLGGALRGRTTFGAVIAKLEGEPEVNIESDQGNINLTLPANSGASVRLTSESGALTGPDSLNSGQSSGGGKLLSGRLKGASRGSVVVKTKAGAVRIR